MAQDRHETNFIKYLTDEEFKRIEDWVERLQSPSMKACLKVMMFTGIRVGEAVDLKRSNFNADFSKLTYSIKKKKTPEIKERYVPEVLRIHLAAYYRAWHQRCREGYLFFPGFRNQSKNPHIKRSSIGLKFRDLRRELKLTSVYHTRRNGNKLNRVSPHTLRHYFLWRVYVASGRCIITTRDIIGHVKTETTAGYLRSVEAIHKQKEIIERAFQPSTALQAHTDYGTHKLPCASQLDHHDIEC